jgi:hypothetical protein
MLKNYGWYFVNIEFYFILFVDIDILDIEMLQIISIIGI